MKRELGRHPEIRREGSNLETAPPSSSSCIDLPLLNKQLTSPQTMRNALQQHSHML
jgi:hypothetical protein